MAHDAHWAVTETDLVPFRLELSRLMRKSAARTVLFTDTAGHLLTYTGQRPEIDVQAFLALCAGDYAASREMAGMLGEDRFQALYHESDHHQIYITEMGTAALLILLFDHGSTLGLVRWAVKKYRTALARALNRALKGARDRAVVAGSPIPGEPTAQSVDDALDAFFDA